MPEIILTTRPGEQLTLDATPGTSLMQTICDQGAEELLALCGGVCSGATCHAYIDGAFADKLPPLSPTTPRLTAPATAPRNHACPARSPSPSR